MIRAIAFRVVQVAAVITVLGIAAAALLWEPFHELGATIAYLGVVLMTVGLLTCVAGGTR